MNEKLIESKEEQLVELKKVYTPPSVTLYGKLTDLTAGGSKNMPESTPGEEMGRQRP